MNRKFLVIAIAFVAVAALAVPVMAEPTKGQKVSASITVIGGEPEVPGELWVTNGGILQERNGEHTVYNILTIGSQDYNVYSSNVQDLTINFKTGAGVIHYDAVWYIPEEGSESGFKGNVEAKISDFNYISGTFDRLTVHCVTQGFGDFAGQTLMLSYDGPPGIGVVWTGYCLKG